MVDLSPSEILERAGDRMIATAPSRAAIVRVWIARNREKLLPLASALLKQFIRSPNRLGASESQGAEIVSQLTRSFEHRVPEMYAWAQANTEVLRLMFRAMLSGLREHPPSLEAQLGTSLYPIDLPRTPSERMTTNVTAVKIAAAGKVNTEAERQALLRFTGFGGLSLEKLAGLVPKDWIPDTKALVDEFYSLPILCTALATLLVTLFPLSMLTGLALEPAAGIGRFVGALSARPELQGLSWLAVEYSRLSATICGLLYPFVKVYHSAFEAWIAEHYSEVAGQLALVVTNPPYGKRGANKVLDPDREYRIGIAYLYFVRRCFDLLRPGGLGIALVPNGFLSGTSAPIAREREWVLRRHHLLFAYRLPSNIYPGADIVTDLSVWRSRGGELPGILPGDEPIARGQYFELFPEHVLGEARMSARGRYQVLGEFVSFPHPRLREDCTTCAVRPFIAQPSPKAPPESVPPEIEAAAALGQRVAQYSSLAASARESEQHRASALHPELLAGVEAWLNARRALLGEYNPTTDRELSRAARRHPSVAALLGIFNGDGSLTPAFSTPPAYSPQYQGPHTISDQAEWLYAQRRTLTIKSLCAFRASFGQPDDEGAVEDALVAQGWCEDWPLGSSEWIPARDYYSGELWPKLERARATGTQRAMAQAARLLDLIGTITLDDCAPAIRDAWVPPSVTRDFLAAYLGIEVPELHWNRALFVPTGVDYADVWKLDSSLQTALGYINHDLSYFHPTYHKRTDPNTGEEESAEQALDRARVEYNQAIQSAFTDWIAKRTEHHPALFAAYSRNFRGYVAPEYPQKPLPIARWGNQITLKPHQMAGAWRLIANNGGLLAFGVGVGKTLTGTATVGYLREIGRARRPLIIVPNTIIWKWHREIQRALPDYRVVVIGSTRYLGKDGTYQSKLDEKSERLAKWTQFKLGLFDVALCTYSVFANTGITEESLRLFIEETPSLLREVGLKTAKLTNEIEKIDGLYEKRDELIKKALELQTELSQSSEGDQTQRTKIRGKKKERSRETIEAQLKRTAAALERLEVRLSRLQSIAQRLAHAADMTERRRAIMQESINEWIAEYRESNEAASDGIDFESLHVDLLILDEAQNMKNLWPVEPREGGVPKYLGAITEASDRALAFALRAFLTQRETGGSGVILLSATPAKNSPLEFFTLLGFVDHYAWTRKQIYDADGFIDRYLRLEQKAVLQPDGTIESRAAVVGFKLLFELRDIINRFADFKDAVDVGLKLPETKRTQIFVPMNALQKEKYEEYRIIYERSLSSRNPADRYRALGILQRMALVALHPELDEPPVIKSEEGKKEKRAWTWSNAVQFKNPASPKLVEAVKIVTNRPFCAHIIFCDNVGIHRVLRDLLVSAGIASERIAILNADRAPKPLQRQQIAEGFNGQPAIIDFNTGEVLQAAVEPIYDVVIANAVAYEGIDLQVRTCDVTHLDLPMEPATLEQRNGRAVRQGNMQAVVEIFYLLSEKSYDAIKLGLITGKLRWMSDILKGADRETNNPAAGMDLSVEDMLLFLADDPDAAKRALDQIKERAEQDRRANAERRAWQTLAKLITYQAMARSYGDELQREQANKDADKAVEYLRQVPADIWPWSAVVDLVLSGVPTVVMNMQVAGDGVTAPISASRALWDGLYLSVSQTRGVYCHVSKAGFLSYRVDGEHSWNATSSGTFPEQIANAVGLAPPAAFFTMAPDDGARWRESLRATLVSSSYAPSLEWLGFAFAPEHWRDAVWTEFGAQIVQALRTVEMPIREGSSLGYRTAQRSAADVIPPTDSGFAELLERVQQGRHRYARLNDIVKGWWVGRQMPRGIADDRELLWLRAAGTDQPPIAVRVEPGSMAEFVAVETSERVWNVGHTPSGVFWPPATNLDLAKLGVRLLATIFTDAADRAVQLGPRELTTLEWLAKRTEVPTLSEALKHHEQGTRL